MQVLVSCFKQFYHLLMKNVQVKVTFSVSVLGKYFSKPMFGFRCYSLSEVAGIAFEQFSTLLSVSTTGTTGIIR